MKFFFITLSAHRFLKVELVPQFRIFLNVLHIQNFPKLPWERKGKGILNFEKKSWFVKFLTKSEKFLNLGDLTCPWGVLLKLVHKSYLSKIDGFLKGWILNITPLKVLQRYPAPQTNHWSGTFFIVFYMQPALMPVASLDEINGTKAKK